MSQKTENVYVNLNTIPQEDNIILRTSSFFRNNPKGTELPSPQEVRAAHQESLPGPLTLDPRAPHIVRYHALGLCVKYSQRASINEARAMYLVNHYLGLEFPAPEIYGWLKDGADIFLYMQLIDGEPLDDIWGSLPEVDKQDICKEIYAFTSELATTRQIKGHEYIGGVTKDLRIPERQFTKQPFAGPFSKVADFHDWFIGLKDHSWDEFRPKFPDDCPIQLAHGDLHQSNLIVKRDATGRLTLSGVVDWEMSSWMPQYWDYCRARWTLDPVQFDDTGEIYMPLVFDIKYGGSEVYGYWQFFIERLGFI